MVHGPLHQPVGYLTVTVYHIQNFPKIEVVLRISLACITVFIASCVVERALLRLPVLESELILDRRKDRRV